MEVVVGSIPPVNYTACRRAPKFKTFKPQLSQVQCLERNISTKQEIKEGISVVLL